MDMTSAEELGLVWMGDMLLHNDPGGLMINSGVDPHRTTFFSEAQQTIEEMRQQNTPMDMNGFVMLDELEEPYLEEESNALGIQGVMPDVDPLNLPDEVTIKQEFPLNRANPHQGSSTQQQPHPQHPQPPQPPRKIKPVKHPALKLQTPIAYQRDTDPNVIPIHKDGMAVCEKCGAIGVKHAFYTRERRFCSLACARGSADGPPPPTPSSDNDEENSYSMYQHKMEIDSEVNVRIHASLPPPPPPPPPLEEEPQFPPDKRTQPHLAGTYEWTELLSEEGFTAASVSSFNHAPMSNNWDNITVGMKVEVENTDCDNYSEGVPDSFWVATVLKIAGYKALLRYEGFGQNESKDFWVNLCSSMVHPVGWCANRGKPLIPPKTIEDKYKDWKHFLVKRLTGARTLPSNFYNKVHENMKSRFRCDLNLEVVDKNRISQVKVATIKQIIGKRLHVRYYDADPGDNECHYLGFWAHEDSPLIHPVGWAKRVGQTLAAPPIYVDRCLKGLRDKDDATEDLFPLANSLPYHTGFRAGMKLEAVDPLNLSSICVATVMKVLNDGYLLIRIDSYEEDMNSPGSDWFCYHSSSACVLPPGFCNQNGITLTPPRGYDAATFDWADYLTETGSIPAPAELFDIETPEHGFIVGQRLEAADLMDPRLVCVGTIAQIVCRLVRIHFDGWEDDYDQWLDYQSPDMYPVGWCQLVSHKLEGPHTGFGQKPSPPCKNKSDGRPGRKRKGRRGMQRKNFGKLMEERLAGGDTSPSARSNNSSTSSSKCDTSSLSEGIHQELESQQTEPEQLPASTPISVTLSLNSKPTRPSGDMVEGKGQIPEEIGEVPAQDQALPEETEPKADPSSMTKVKEVTPKLIPKLVDASEPLELSKVDPSDWDEMDVGQFLTLNNCAPYCESFTNKKINGKVLLTLTKDQIIDLTGMKVGPSLKIYDLIQQLKNKVNPGQDRIRLGVKKFF
ncbi:scm-related gene containing four mbt domains isoform X3 [Rhodnius prolixus]|uniref:scm-related gene containing four mbt domains isoform X3 n=2 Tax=Rhodnius prolixus TaxID=13249 RepID=UPI003D18B14B